MTTVTPQARRWHINGLQLEALCWGDPGARPLLCLHGWLDNAASFSLLAPLLEGFQVVALDLSGHGRSSRRSADATYQIWDDLPEIVGVVDALGWDQFNVLGHSRGAIITALLGSVIPQRVSRLVLLDAIAPQAVPENEFVQQMGKFLQDKARLLERSPRVFQTTEDAVNSRAIKGLSLQAARLLAERNLRPTEGGYTWTTDPRLRGASAVKLTGGQIEVVLKGLLMPTLVLMAQGGFGAPALVEAARRLVPDICVEEVAGGHHFHMEHDLETVAARIVNFLDS